MVGELGLRPAGQPPGRALLAYAGGPRQHLAETEEHFPALLELLQIGETTRLGRLPVSRGLAAKRVYDAGAVPYPTGRRWPAVKRRSTLGTVKK